MKSRRYIPSAGPGIDELEDELVPLDEVADTDEELEKVKELQNKIDALSQLSLALMSNDWKKE